MYQLAQQKQRRIDSSHRAPAREQSTDCSPNKRALTDSLRGYMGEPDLYTRTTENAQRELEALRSTTLPNLVAVRRKRDLAPLTKQVELANAAMQVRALILAANVHVYTLEAAATHADPMNIYLRNCLDRVVTRATKLGAYDGAMDMRPATYEDKSFTQGTSATPTQHKPRVTTTQLSGAMPAQARSASNPKAGNTPQRMRTAHEAAHIIQQRRGVSLDGGVDDGPHDSYERFADEVADAVVAGRSVEHMFDDGARAASTPVVQRKAGSAKAQCPRNRIGEPPIRSS